VSFDCPWGPSSILTNNEDGVLVENGNTNLLADAISSLMDDPIKLRTLARNATVNVQRYQMDKIAHQWKDLFENLA
jgi:glycosyltransferase involved in cell wall biosynthesis